MTPDAPSARPVSPAQLFRAFTWLALQGFGGVLAVAQRVLCEERRWLTREQFVEILAIAQVLPGPNICNMALMIGDRFFGWRGAFAALAGMMALPLVIVLVLTALYTRFAGMAQVSGALRGMGAVSAGLIAGTALKLLPNLRRNVVGTPACTVLALLAFAAVALLRWPLVAVLAVLGSTACSLAWIRLRAGQRAPSVTNR
ncbi:MAG: chromate transporter [Burkholderiales bacterium]|nr:chromate transporter [Burkholderiales bacterium]